MAPYKSTDLQIFRLDYRQILNVSQFRQQTSVISQLRLQRL
jgi:hypothetical protein